MNSTSLIAEMAGLEAQEDEQKMDDGVRLVELVAV